MQEIEVRLSRYLAFVANRAVHAIRRAWTAGAAERGLELTPEEFMVLEMLVVRDGLTQSELTDVALRDRTTVTRLVDGLVRKGLARREHASDDRRIVRAMLTARGRKVHEQATAMAMAIRGEAMAGVASAELETTMAVLQRVRRNLLGHAGGSGMGELGGEVATARPRGGRGRTRRPA